MLRLTVMLLLALPLTARAATYNSYPPSAPLTGAEVLGPVAQGTNDVTTTAGQIAALAGQLPLASVTALGPITTNVNLYGYQSTASGCTVIANNPNPAAQAAVIGGWNTAYVRANYGGLDQVTCYGENTANPPPYVVTTGVSFAGTGGITATLPSAMSAATQALLKKGMTVETTNLFRGLLQSWTTNTITVDFWTALASNPTISGTPSAYGGATPTSLGLEVGGTDQIWGWNLNLTLQPGMWTKPDANGNPRSASMIGDEYSLANNAVPFVRNEYVPLSDFPRALGQFMGCGGTYGCGSAFFALGTYDKGFTNSNGSGAYAGFLNSANAAQPLVAAFVNQQNFGNLIAARPVIRGGFLTYAVDEATGTTTKGLTPNHQTIDTTIWFAAPSANATYPMFRDGAATGYAGNALYPMQPNTGVEVTGRAICRLPSDGSLKAWSIDALWTMGATPSTLVGVGASITALSLGSANSLANELLNTSQDNTNGSPVIYITGVAGASCSASLMVTSTQ